MKAVTLLSGGMDSVTLAYYLKSNGYDLHGLSFFYGQRHKKELRVAEWFANLIGMDYDTILLHTGKYLSTDDKGSATYETSPLSAVLKGSSLTDDEVEVPDGHYAEESMKATVVPNRNAIMLSIAYGVAVAEHADIVAFAAHSGDHAIYPDCRPIFVGALSDALELGNEWAEPVPEVKGPFLNFDKAGIVKIAAGLDVPLGETWSCYKGGEIHCGRCGTCVERKEAFREAKVYDPTRYSDPAYKIDAYVLGR